MKKRTLFIIRGLPGSAKSTLAQHLAKLHGGSHFEADMAFINTSGQYLFDKNKIGIAHSWCQDMVKEALENDEDYVIVSNTFTTRKEMNPYFKMAKQNGYSVFVIHCENDFGNCHSVPQETLDRMKKRWEKL